MDYTDFTQTIGILAEQAASTTNPPYTLPTDFQNILPRAIEYAEDRIYREMVFLATRAQDASLMFTPGQRTLNLTAATVIIVIPEGLAAITPANTIPSLGKRIQFYEASLDVIDSVWPQESATMEPGPDAPMYWAMKDAQTIVISPSMDAGYVAEITGLFQPARLSSTNSTTYITLSYPDLMVAAAMIFVTGYLRNYGAQADTAQMGMSWEQVYKNLSASATLEEQRRRGQGSGWSQNTATPLAKPDRT